MEQTPDKKNDNFQKDGKEQFNRSIGLISNFALGFTYLSPLTAVYSLFALAVTLAGPPAVWWILIVACGQLLVALVFGEVASQYPITGGFTPGPEGCGARSMRGSPPGSICGRWWSPLRRSRNIHQRSLNHSSTMARRRPRCW